MNRFGTLLVIAAFVIAAFTQMITTKKDGISDSAEINGSVKIPKKVQAVIDKSCYGCHSEKGKSDKAKDKMQWDKLDEYDNAKLVSVMDDIIDVVSDEEMPPKKFLEKNPDVKPTADEYALLMNWAEKEANKLTK